MAVLVEARNVSRFFETRMGTLHAVDGVSFQIEEGKTLGIVGERILREIHARKGNAASSGEHVRGHLF